MTRNLVGGRDKAEVNVLGDLRSSNLGLEELDQAGNVVASYIASQSASNDTERIDVVVSFLFICILPSIPLDLSKYTGLHLKAICCQLYKQDPLGFGRNGESQIEQIY